MTMMMSGSKCWLLFLSVVFILLCCGASVRANDDGDEVALKTTTTLEETKRQNNEAAVEANTAAETALKNYAELVEEVIDFSVALENMSIKTENIKPKEELKENNCKEAYNLIIETKGKIYAANGILRKIKIPGFSNLPNELEVIKIKISKTEKEIAELKTNTELHGNNAEIDFIEIAEKIKTLANKASNLWKDMVKEINKLVEEIEYAETQLTVAVKTISEAIDKLNSQKDTQPNISAEVENTIKLPLSNLLKIAKRLYVASKAEITNAEKVADKYDDLLKKAEELSKQIQNKINTEKQQEEEKRESQIIPNDTDTKEESGNGQQEEKETTGRGDSSRVVVAHFATFFIFYLLYASVCVDI